MNKETETIRFKYALEIIKSMKPHQINKLLKEIEKENSKSEPLLTQDEHAFISDLFKFQ